MVRLGQALAVAAIGCAASGLACAQDAKPRRFELTAYGAYRVGGEFEDENGEDTFELDESNAYGLVFNFPAMNVDTQWQALWARQQTELETRPGFDADSRLGIDVDDFDAVYERAKAMGILDTSAFGTPLRSHPQGWVQLYLRDPAGNLLEVDCPDVTALAPSTVADIVPLEDSARQEGDARRVLAQLQEASQSHYVSPYHFAYVHTGLGEHDTAIGYLERALEQRAGAIYGLKGSFLFVSLRSHPRFIALLRRMNLA